MVIITDPMKKYILAKSKKGYNKSEYDKRIRQHAIRGIQDLTFLLEESSENIQAEIFTEKNLEHLIYALFNIPHKLAPGKRISENTRIRLLKVFNRVLTEIGTRQNASQLALDTWKRISQISTTPQDELYGTRAIQTIQIEGFSVSKLSPQVYLNNLTQRGI